jgi:hypothetical protein
MSNNQYSQKINTNSPGLFIILVDQSISMNNKFGNSKKSTVATNAVNRVIYELRVASRDGSEIRNRLYVGVIGYGKTVDGLLGGPISDLKHIEVEEITTTARDNKEITMPMPIYLKPKAENGTPMDIAFGKAYDAAYSWIKHHQDSFPPIVLNLTDGVPNDLQHGGNGKKTHDAAIRLMNLGTDHGKLLLFNAHFGNINDGEVLLPSTKSELNDQYAQYLFDFTSTIPSTLIENAKLSGFNPKSGAKGLVFNASAEFLIKFIDFGSSKFV